MTTDIVSHIADHLKNNLRGLNCFNFIARKFEDNPVILEGKYVGMSDSERVSGYIRYREDDNDHQYQRIDQSEAKKFTSCGTDGIYIVATQLRLVLVHRFSDEQGCEKYVASLLSSIDWNSYSGSEKEINLVLESSNTNKEFIYYEESKEKEDGDMKTPPNHVNLLMIDFSLGYRTNVCETVNFNQNECL